MQVVEADGVGDERRAGHQPPAEQREPEAEPARGAGAGRGGQPRRRRRGPRAGEQVGAQRVAEGGDRGVREVAERPLEVLRLLGRRALLRREPGGRALQPEQRHVDVGRDDELDAAQPVAQRAQPGEVVGGRPRRAPRRRASSRSPGPSRPSARPARRARPRRRRSSPTRRGRRRRAGRPAPIAAASSSPTPRLDVRVGSRRLGRHQRQADGVRRLDVGGASRRAAARPGPARRAATSRSPARARRRARRAASRRSPGRRRTAGTWSPRRAARSRRQRAGDARRPPRRPSGWSRSCPGR